MKDSTKIKRQHQQRGSWMRSCASSLALVSLLSLAGCSSAPMETTMSTGSGKLPVSFIANAGQTDPAVHFQARVLGGMAFFTSEGPTLSVPRSQAAPSSRRDEGLAPRQFSTLHLHYLGANPNANVVHGDALPGIANFLVGEDPSAWHTNVPTYGGIAYENLYPNIRIRYDGLENNLESTIEVAPFADPSVVRWKYDGARSQRIDQETGNLVVVVGTAERDGDEGEDALIESAPIAWQTIDGENRFVDVRFDLDTEGAVHCELGAYDHSLPLVIDPAIMYTTFLGSSNYANARAMAVDGGGNSYITGETTSSTLFPNPNGKDPTYNGGNDVFLAKLDPNGASLLYSTYLGDTGNDIAYDVAVDGQQQAWIVGATENKWPLKFAAQGFRAGGYEGFVAKMNATGTDFVFSSYHGGLTAGNGDDHVYSVAIDSTGNGYVTGTTTSTNFFTTADGRFQTPSGGKDAFFTKWSSSGARLYGTYLGGSGDDIGRAVTTSPWGVVVAGETASTNFGPVTAGGGADMSQNGGIDAFLVGFYSDTNGTWLQGATYIGGPLDDIGRGVAVDNVGYTYVVGETTSTSFPFGTAYQVGTGGGKDAFVAKTDYVGWGAYSLMRLASPLDDVAQGVAIDEANNVFVAGSTFSSSFASNAPTARFGPRGAKDIFVTKLLSGGTSASFNVLLGGSGNDDGNDIAVNAGGIYVAGTSTSSDYPVLAASGFTAYDNAFAGGTSPVVTKLSTNGWSVLFSTYVDGVAADEANAVATLGNAVFIAGTTTSAGFPTKLTSTTYAGGLNDAFVTKLDSLSNSLIYSTYLGGADADFATSISVNNAGQATVVGYTKSTTGFPIVNPAPGIGPLGGYDAFLSRLNSTGTGFTTSFRFGGGGSDFAQDVAVANEQAFVVGYTVSADFPKTNGVVQGTKCTGLYDAFITRLDLSGATPSFNYATYLCGTGNDYAYGVAADGLGNAFVTGKTASTDFPLMNPLQSALGGSYDIFVTKIRPDGTALDFSTYLGGAGSDIGRDIAVDTMGTLSIVGETQSDGILESCPALSGVRAGNTDGLFAKLDSSGQCSYWTYFGGTGEDFLNGVAVNPSTGVATFVGTTASSNLPTIMPVLQGTNLKGGYDAFAGRLDDTGGFPSYTFLSYLGGGANDYGRGVALIGDDAVVVGVTASGNFASNAVVPGYDSSFNGETDAFMTRLDL